MDQNGSRMARRSFIGFKLRSLSILKESCITICVASSITLFGCSQQFGATETGALAGTALGAGLGAIVGHETGHTGGGIAIGSAAGALAGALLGSQTDKQQSAIDQRNARLEQQERQLAENRRLIDQLRSRGADARSTGRGVVVNLPDVLFDFDRARLTADAVQVTNGIADVLKDVKGRYIAVEGHTDSVGTAQYNQRLSEQRAWAVADELVARGLPKRNIAVRGFGESVPVASNATSTGRQNNRRVEVIVENR